VSESSAAGVAEHFVDGRQQTQTAKIGMWAFLAQEVMFFGGLFCAYIVYRAKFPAGFAEASHHLDIALGAVNTAVLLGSSLTMALAVREAQLDRRRGVARFIAVTFALALVFLAIKYVEYAHKFHDHLVPGHGFDVERFADGAELFYGLYFVMTGMHALHMIVGLVLMVFVARRALEGRYSPQNYIGVEVLGLYWHFVDLIWIFLFPLLYLLGRHT